MESNAGDVRLILTIRFATWWISQKLLKRHQLAYVPQDNLWDIRLGQERFLRK